MLLIFDSFKIFFKIRVFTQLDYPERISKNPNY